MTSLLAVGLLCVSTRAQGDVAFTRRLGEVRAAAAPGFARPVGLRDWFKAPEPSRVPSPQEADGERVLRAGGRLYFLDGGRVFERDLASGRTAHLEGSSRVAAILLYKGALIARRGDGDVYLWAAEKRVWVDIGNRAQDLRVAGDDLVALTRKGELWVYRGEPGPMVLTWIFIPMQSGDVTTFLMVPVFSGHRVAFFDAKVRGVSRLEPFGEDLTVVFADGRRVPYSSLAIPRP